MQQSIRRKARALIKSQDLERPPTRLRKQDQILILNNHAPKVKRLETNEAPGELKHPGANIASPVLRNQVEHSRTWLPLELHRLYVAESVEKLLGRACVAEGDCDVLSCERVEMVPSRADERDGVAVLWIGYVRDDALEDCV